MENEMVPQLSQHKVVSKEQWEAEYKEYLKGAKEFMRLYDKKMEERRQLPWMAVEKNYVFDGPNGTVTLSDLFEGRSQLVVQHFMFGPDDEEGCVGCSFTADHVDSARQHFENNDLSYAAVSRAPISRLLEYKKRMGWDFNWVSSFESSFNYDYHVSFRKEDLRDGKGYYNYEWIEMNGGELPGTSVFYKDENGIIYYTYSSFGRGDELLIGAYNYLDITPKGRNETGPNGDLTDWVRHHDKYEKSGFVDKLGHYHETIVTESCCSPSGAKQ